MAPSRKICVGMIAGAHGVRGLVRLRSFTEEPGSITAYGELSDETGKRIFEVELKSSLNDHFIAAIDGVNDREAADELRGTKLYVPRARLPKARKGEYYETDLVGLKAQDKNGKDFGAVLAVHNYGAGTFLEIGQGRKDSFMLPFTNAFVPEVEIEAGHVTIEPPEGWLDAEKPKGKPKTKPKAGPKSRGGAGV